MMDLQDPSRSYSDMIRVEKWKTNSVITKESNTDKFILRTFKNIYYNFLNKLSMHNPEKNIIGSGLYDKKVIEFLKSLKDPYPI